MDNDERNPTRPPPYNKIFSDPVVSSGGPSFAIRSGNRQATSNRADNRLTAAVDVSRLDLSFSDFRLRSL